MQKNNRNKIGLALSSGGLRGLAHIGVIKVLIKNNIPIDYISGSSSGALVASYYATFGEIESLEKQILENSREILPNLFGFSLRGGFLTGRKITIFLEKILKEADFSKTKIPLAIITTDLITGQPVTFTSGKIVPALRGSISVPLLFKPFFHKKHLLVDGGLSDPVPVEILKIMGAQKTIAVNLYHKNEFNDKKFTFSGVALRSTRIALHNLSKKSLLEASIVLNPDTSSHISKLKMADYFKAEKIKKIISDGEKEAEQYLSEIKKLLI